LEELLSKTKIGVFDMVYLPLKTELIIAADSKRLKTIKGLSMLISQAVVGWEKWTGMNIPKAWYLELENFVEAKCLDS
jgi:shikimate dehydrogenase